MEKLHPAECNAKQRKARLPVVVARQQEIEAEIAERTANSSRAAIGALNPTYADLETEWAHLDTERRELEQLIGRKS